MKKSKRNGVLGKVFAGLGALCVTAGVAFSVMWFVPGIHDKIWTPTTDTTETTDDTTTDDTTKTA